VELIKNFPMDQLTSLGVGGPADFLCKPKSVAEIQAALNYAREHQLPVTIVGYGSNLLVTDKGIRGLVIQLAEHFAQAHVVGAKIRATAGCLLSSLSKLAAHHSLTGLEFAVGIPGSLGGAIYMNAGAYGGEIKQCVVETDYIDTSGNLHTLVGDEHKFRYRGSFFTDNPGNIILRTRIKLSQGEKEQIQERMRDLMERRNASQPLQYPSAGSFFKRPEGHYAGKLISDSDLRGKRCGDAEVSKKHAGFIINIGNADCSDVLCLMDSIQRTVKERFGVDLEPEVKIIGEDR